MSGDGLLPSKKARWKRRRTDPNRRDERSGMTPATPERTKTLAERIETQQNNVVEYIEGRADLFFI